MLRDVDGLVAEYLSMVDSGRAELPNFDFPIRPGEEPFISSDLLEYQEICAHGFGHPLDYCLPVFVLGSQDAEMDFVERVFTRFRIAFAYGGPRGQNRRVAPGEDAYSMRRAPHSFSMRVPHSEVFRPIDKDVMEIEGGVVGIELALEAPEGRILPVIDHHLHGDPRTAAGPRDAWLASSAGQVVWFLHPAIRKQEGAGRDLVAEAVMVGESDHNLPAFVQGAGYTPREIAEAYVLRTRWEAFARPSGVSQEEFVEAVSIARATLASRVSPALGYADLRDLEIDGPQVQGTGEQYPSAAQYLPVAASLEQVPYAVHIRRRDGRKALRLGGFPSDHPALLQFAKDPGSWGCGAMDAPRPDNSYAFPARGMGGGVLVG